MNLFQKFAALATVSTLSLGTAFAERPPADSKPAVEIVELLEMQGYGPFIEVEFDDGQWEVEAYKNEVAYELNIDRRTGKILSSHRDDAEQRPPRDAKPLSQILRKLMQSGYADIEDVSFERRYWEIEAYREDGKHELYVDPTTGDVISDRRD
jgi:uncharacterized membrane protein YkoI